MIPYKWGRLIVCQYRWGAHVGVSIGRFFLHSRFYTIITWHHVIPICVYNCEQNEACVKNARICCQPHKSFIPRHIVIRNAWIYRKNFVSLRVGRAGAISRSEGFLNYSQRIGYAVTNNLCLPYRWDENNSKKKWKKTCAIGNFFVYLQCKWLISKIWKI